MFEVFSIGFGSFFAAMYVLAVVLNPTLPNATRLLIAATIVGLGLAHRRVRIEQLKGPMTLHQKALAEKR